MHSTVPIKKNTTRFYIVIIFNGCETIKNFVMFYTTEKGGIE